MDEQSQDVKSDPGIENAAYDSLVGQFVESISSTPDGEDMTLEWVPHSEFTPSEIQSAYVQAVNEVRNAKNIDP